MRASPLEAFARKVSISGSRMLGYVSSVQTSAMARLRMEMMSAEVRGERVKVRQRERSAFWTLKEGFLEMSVGSTWVV